MTTSLTREEFNAACTALVAESSLLENHEALYRGLKGWTVVASPVSIAIGNSNPDVE